MADVAFGLRFVSKTLLWHLTVHVGCLCAAHRGPALDARIVVITFLSMTAHLPPHLQSLASLFNPANPFGIFELQVLVNVVHKRMLAQLIFLFHFFK